jgi:aryl hydrocarbon receptor nuclear translocator-like protein 1
MILDHWSKIFQSLILNLLLGSSVYEHVLYDDIPGLVEAHKKCLKAKEEIKVASFKFRCKDGRFVGLQSIWKQFRNPWNKEIDFLVAR